jgi:tetratricopeptide (TPR) repeat protein
MIARIASLLLGLALALAGGFGIAAAARPDLGGLDAVRGLVDRLAPLAGTNALAVERALAATPLRFGLAGAGAFLLWFALLRRARPTRLHAADARTPDRKAASKAAKLAKKGDLAETGEAALAAGRLEEAAVHFEKGGDLARAAEVRLELRQYERAADLYLRAEQPETAGRIYADRGVWAKAAECYAKAQRLSVAAEMYEKAVQWRRAGECYLGCEFHRQAAQAFIKGQDWARAAAALEEVIREETLRTGTGMSPQQERDVKKLVFQASKLYEEAGDLDAALRVLERGASHAEAAQVALRLGLPDRAAEFFQKARDARGAVDALRKAGQESEASRVLGEHLRDSGDLEGAARSLEQAGEWMAAGDLYRQIEQFERAGACYEQCGDPGQAAEMFRLSGDLARAASCYEQAGEFDQAAACHAEAGDPLRQAAALARATRYLAAGQLFHQRGRLDEAIEALQQVDAQSSDHAAASALLGEILEARGQAQVALAKLEQAVGAAEPTRDTVVAHYQLALALEQAGRLADAAARYEKVLAVDVRFRDAGERLASCRERAAREAAGPGTTGASAAGPTRPGRYLLQGELGRGGMGIVYRAHDTVLDRTVALKVLPEALRENAQALENFLREAKSAAKLNHPNIVTVYDAGEQEGRFYIAMEFVDGTTLKEVIKKRGPIAPGGVLNVLLQMCEALGYAHDQKVVHRDVKTANTMWTRDRKAKIMDFGLAKVVEEVRNHTTLVSGTPYYMSPEQTLGKNVDHRTDIYSLGVTIFELATGSVPFREGNIPYHHVHTPPPDPRELVPGLPALLVKVVGRCLQKDPGDRFQSTREIVALVKEALARSSAGRTAT